MAVTFTGTTTSGITLNNTAQNPATIAAGSVIESNPDSFAVYGGKLGGGSTYPWIVYNYGTIAGIGSSSTGVLLEGGGRVFNGGLDAGATITGATITGGRQGISIARYEGSVKNYGLVSASATGGVGVALHAGGAATNFGTLSGYTTGLEIDSGPGTVANYGTITATGSFGLAYGIRLNGAPGTTIINQLAGVIGSPDVTALYATGDAAYVSNAGTIAGIIDLAAGGSIANNASATITAGILASNAPVTIANYGTLSGFRYAASLGSGGTVTNHLGGTIASTSAIDGLMFAGAGTAANYGAIVAAGTDGGDAIDMLAGGTIANGSPADTTALIQDNLFSKDVAIQAFNDPVAVTNYGTIDGGYGVDLRDNGALTNAGAAATIIGQYFGVFLENTDISTTAVNLGTIRAVGAPNDPGFGSTGVEINASATIVNGSPTDTSARIAADESGVTSGAVGTISRGVQLGDGASLVNYGTVTGSGQGAFVTYGATIVNGSGGDTTALLSGGRAGIDSLGTASIAVTNFGTIAGTGTTGIGIAFTGALSDTLTNAGVITGAGGTAVAFGGTSANLLVLDPGAVFSGAVIGNISAGNTLELASAATTGTIAGLGGSITNFGSIAFDAGAKWFLAGTPGGLSGNIGGFTHHDTIEVSGITATGSVFLSGALTLSESSGHVTLTLPGDFATTDFIVTNTPEGAEITLACFAAGTRIHTASGEIPVEQLRIDDRLPTLRGRLAPITWLGHRTLDCRRHPRPHEVFPVRIRAHAFGPNLPHRDLYLSPDHAIFLDNTLVPVRHLINNRTVLQEPAAEITYYHLELPTHDVILAEGLPCETYLDTGNRQALEARHLHHA